MKKLEVLLKDMSHNTEYSFLEQGSDDKKLDEIASRFGVQLPANDLAIFKGTYAYINRTNLNGCSLPEEEVVKALHTLRGKAIDFDHLRKRVVGYFIDAELEGDEIICYGIFFKGNFPEDYDIIKDCMSKGTLGISFEAWGEHVHRDDGDYDLVDIEFAGGALLIDSEPAFPGAGVLELSKKQQDRVLEFAKVMTEPKEYVHAKNNDKEDEQTNKRHETARYAAEEFNFIMRALSEVPWHEGEEDCWREISSIDFENNEVIVTYQPSGTTVKVDLTPSSEVTKKGNPNNQVVEEEVVDVKPTEESTKDEEAFIEKFHKFDGKFDALEAFIQKEMDYKNMDFPEVAQLSIKERTKLADKEFAVLKKIKNETSGKRRKVRMFPLNDRTHIKIALARLQDDNVKETFEKLGISYPKIKKRILNKAKELKMNELLTKFEECSVEEQAALYANSLKEIASLKNKVEELAKAQEGSSEEIETKLAEKDEEIASLQEKLEKITVAADEAQAELDRRDEELKEATLAERKEALGDFAEDMEEADILDDTKYELALLKKENKQLRETAKKTDDAEGNEDLDKGSRQKKSSDELLEIQERVLRRAYGE